MEQDTATGLIITFGALILLAVRFIFPELLFDMITIGILVIAILPWTPSFIKRIKAGDFEIETRERLEMVEDTVEKVNDTLSEEEIDIDEASIELNNEDLSVLRSLIKANVPLRSAFGISKDTQLSVQDVDRSLDTLVNLGLAAEVQGKKGIRWGITPLGRKHLEQNYYSITSRLL